MPTTLNKIAEQIRRAYYGGNPSDDAELHLVEVKHLVLQQLNSLLKVEQIRVNNELSEYFPSHHLISTYEGVEVDSVTTPTITLECTDMADLVVTSVEMLIEHISDDPDTYTITISGLVFEGDVTAEDLVALVEDAGESCVLKFITEDFGPFTFLIAGIEDFAITDDELTFTYYPDGIPEIGYWLTADGTGWVTGDDYYWQLPDGSVDPLDDLPTAISDFVEVSHLILAGVSVGDDSTIDFNFTGAAICCMVTDELEIDGYSVLPAMPITLPRGMGVWRVYRPAAPNAPFIPLSSQQMAMASQISHTNLSGILGALMAYEYRDNRNLQFNQPASVIGATVTIQLLVEDYSQSHDSILPIPADMEAKVIEDTLKVLLVNRNVPVDKNNDDNDQR